MDGAELDHVTKIYANGVRAVDAVDLEIGDGEFMVLVGPSGCGKSTLLRMIAGLENVTEGQVSTAETISPPWPAGRTSPWYFRTTRSIPT